MILTVNQLRTVLTEINQCPNREARVEYEDTDGTNKAMLVECSCQVLCDDCMEKLYDCLDWADGAESPNNDEAIPEATA